MSTKTDLLQPLLFESETSLEEKPIFEASPFVTAGIFSRLGFCWLNGLLNIGAKRQLCPNDIPPLSREDASTRWARRFAIAVAEERLRSAPSLLHAAHHVFGQEFYWIGLVQARRKLFSASRCDSEKYSSPSHAQLINDLFGFSGPILLKLIVTFVQDYAAGTASATRGCALVALVIAISVAAAIISTQYSLRMSRIQLHMRTALVSAVYDRVLQCRQTELAGMGLASGQVANMMTVDVERLQNAASSFNSFWSLPLQVGLTLWFLYREVAYAFVAGLAIIVLMIPTNAYIAKAILTMTRKQMVWKDKRIMTCDEILHSIRNLKCFSWEQHIAGILSLFRTSEIKYLSRKKYLDSLCVYLWAALPILTSLSTFAMVALIGHKITPAAVFTTISLLNMLVFPCNAYVWVINGLLEARVSQLRIQRFLLGGNLPVYVRQVADSASADPPSQYCLEIQGTFSWGGLEDEEDSSCFTAQTEALERDIDLKELEGANLLAKYGRPGDAVASAEEVCSERSSCASYTSSFSGPFAFTLRDLQLRIASGEIVGIYGQIGAGKSTLLSVILGELSASSGSHVLLRSQRKVYCSQVPWLQRGSIRDAIVFGRPLDPIRLQQVLHICALHKDLAQMRDGIETQVGDRGGTLSGGQKLRVALARALYGRADSSTMYLLDDPLAGLDGQTAHWVARQMLAMIKAEGATVLLVTHALPLLKHCDWALAMHNGRIVEKVRIRRGSPERVFSSAIAGEMRPETQTTQGPCSVPAQRKSEKAKDMPGLGCMIAKAKDEPLTCLETRAEGTVKLNVYRTYLRAIGHLPSALILFSLLGMNLSSNAFNYWLSIWSNAPSRFGPREFLERSFVITTINTIFTLMRSFSFAYGGLRAASRLHDKLLSAILASKMAFFDANPVGRILNRFAQDTYTVDDTLPFISNILLAQGVALLGTLLVLLLASPWTILILLLIGVFYYRLQAFYRASSRELKRLDSVSRSPIYAHFAETLDGAVTIRSFSCVPRFQYRAIELVDENQKVCFSSNAAAQWLSLRLQIFGVALVTFVATWAVISCTIRKSASAGLVGLSLSYALPIVGNLSALIGSFAETEKEMISVERVREYTTQTPEAAVATSPVRPELLQHWPCGGTLTFEAVSLRYRPHWPLALHRVSFSVRAGEKVGICGRTGSGKTSLLSCLFRLADFEGAIYIDGLPITAIPLQRLRSSLAIIPQDPMLFAGTVRSNVDPAGQYTEAEVQAAVLACRLHTIIGDSVQQTAQQTIAFEIAEKGTNLSLGQRQLICLCRILLKRSQIVCLDECTASVDVVTDTVVRQLIAEHFAHATVIMIAHRLSAVLELCSSVICLKDGQVVEQGPPTELLRRRGSCLSRLQSEEAVTLDEAVK